MRGARGGRFDRLAARLFVEGGEILRRVCGFLLGREHEVVARCFPEFPVGLVAGSEVDAVQRALGQDEVRFRIGKDLFVIDGAGDHGGDALGFAGWLLFHLLLVGVEQIGLRLGQLGGGEAIVDRATEFLLHNGHDLLPAVVRGGDVDGAEFEVIKEDAV